jgi:hypothetical protein
MMMVAKVSQKEEIISYLHQTDPKTGKRRGLSPLEAIGMFRCYRLAARIGELKDDGYDIRTEIRRDAKGKSYARYFLDRA